MRKLISMIFGKNDESDSFSDFFRHTNPQQKDKVFREAARKANEDQRAVLEEANIEIKSR